MPNNWKTYKLSELTELITKGTTPSTYGFGFTDDGINFIKSESTNYDGRLDESSFVKVSIEAHEKLKRSQLKENDILFSMAGAYLGKTGIVCKNHLPANTNQANGIIRINQAKAIPKFVALALRNPLLVNYVNASGGQSAQPNINLTDIGNLEIALPSIPEQKSIASILSTIDDKIENNLAINKTLEEMAMALYKHWFVDFGPFQDGEFVDSELGRIPKGWEVKIFSDLYEVKKGLSYKSKFYSDKGIPMINLKCVDRNGGFRYDGVKYYEGEYKRQHVVLPGDLLVAMTDLTQDRTVLGSPLIAPDLNTSSDVIASLDISILKQIQSETSHLNLFFYYQMRTHKYHEYILGYGNGSTVMHLDKKGLLDYTCFLPSNDVLEKFNELVSDLRNRIELNIKENQTLTQLRDTLLPKLISGEVRLKEFREESITN